MIHWYSNEVWGDWGWTFTVGWVLLSFSIWPSWSINILFLIPLAIGIILVSVSTYLASKTHRALKSERR